jgi:hypothetical protein
MTNLSKNHGRDLLGREGLGLAQILDLDDGVAIAVNDLEGPRLNVFLNGFVVEAATDETPAAGQRRRSFYLASSRRPRHILDVEDGVLGIHSRLVLGRLTDQALLGVEGYEGRSCEASLFIGNLRPVNINALEQQMRIDLLISTPAPS